MGEYYQLFLSAAMLVCALMIVVWLFRIRSKGASAYLMASAFAVFAGLLYAIKQEASTPIRVVLGIVLALLLGADVAVRASRQARERDSRR